MNGFTGKLAAPAGADHSFGVLQLADAQLGVSLQALREVIPKPARFAGLPAAAPGLCGAVNLRGKVVPVVDLRAVLGLPAGAVANPVVAMLSHERRLIGLLADGVRGITRPAPEAVFPMRAAGGLVFTGGFERPEDGSVVSVLDPAAVLALPGLPALHEREDERHDTAAQTRAARRPLMLVRCGDVGLAVDVTDIHTTLPRVDLKPSCFGGRVCRGVVEHGDVELPAVDPLALLGLGALPHEGTCQALLLRLPAGMVALLVTRVIDIAQVDESELLPLPAVALQRPELFRALLHVAGHGEHLVIEAGVLQRQPDVLAMAGMNTRRAGAAAAEEQAAQGGRSHGRPVITFDVGVEAATLLTEVREIVPLPAGRLRSEARHPAVLGLGSHRGQAVTLLCLATLTGRTAALDEHDARVLLVEEGGAMFGFVVPRLSHIESTLWEQPAQSEREARHPLIEVGAAGQRRTLALIDLHAMARSLAAGDDAEAAVASARRGARQVAALSAV
ncbi:MAG TPA: chemotaxis protein CheW [Methylibium sp.]|uniref:chemotaxis protein CheW n=1 Tax=Methylibium sp. TaxID=2067992 RepID=UPI002DBFF00B|nr:chemotaxis protein CheW [Methylibium sp.]HEU4458778.1 chemotaxis protein CheW [Methylibium sp.]